MLFLFYRNWSCIMCYIIFVIRLFLFYRNGSCIICYIIFVIMLFLFYRNGSCITGTILVKQKQPYDKYDIVQNTGIIPVEQNQPYDKYDIAQNTGTITVEQICHKVVSVLQEWFLYSVLYDICHNDCLCSTGMVPVFCTICILQEPFMQNKNNLMTNIILHIIHEPFL
jgi:hypothetical protein